MMDAAKSPEDAAKSPEDAAKSPEDAAATTSLEDAAGAALYEQVQALSCKTLHAIATDLEEVPKKSAEYPHWCLFVQTLEEERAVNAANLIRKGVHKIRSEDLNCVLQEIVQLRQKPWFYPGWCYWIQTCLNKSERASLIRLIYEEIDKRYALLETGTLEFGDILDLSNLQEMTPSADVILDTIVAAPKQKRKKRRARPETFEALFDVTNLVSVPF